MAVCRRTLVKPLKVYGEVALAIFNQTLHEGVIWPGSRGFPGRECGVSHFRDGRQGRRWRRQDQAVFRHTLGDSGGGGLSELPQDLFAMFPVTVQIPSLG